MSIFENIIGFFSPSLALKRAKTRFVMQQLDGLRNYDAATKGRRGNKWASWGTSANTETRKALPTLRERSRDLRRNNGYHSNAIKRIARNVIGTGIRPTAVATNQNLEFVMQAWKKWADKTHCDFNDQMNFYGIQDLVMQAIAESGEVLVLRKRVKNRSKIGFQLQVLESDHIDSLKDGVYGGVKYVQGVEYNKQGKRVAIWIYPEHPNDSNLNNTTSIRVPISDILHIYDVERPGQGRGIPAGVASFLRIKDLDDYEDAQLIRQKIAACFSVFVTETNPDAMLNNKATRDELSRVEPGMIEYLEPGKQVAFAAPPPAEGFKDFNSSVLHSIASGYGMSYEALTNDLSQVNFSSARMGWLEFQRNITHWQENVMIPMFCARVWEWFIDYLIMSGAISEEIDAAWTPPRREMIDPVKEVNGLKMEVRNGFTSWSDAVRQLGYDPNELIRQMVEDNKQFDENGIFLDSDPRRDPRRTNTSIEESEEEEN